MLDSPTARAATPLTSVPGDFSVTQRILILGGDGYLGWPTAMALSRAGHHVAVVDNFAKRQWELELGVRPLFPIPTLHERVRAWREVTEHDIELSVGDLTDYALRRIGHPRLPARHDRPLRRAAVGARTR